MHSHQKRAAIFLCMQRSITKVLQSIAADQTLFLFFLDANRTLPEDRRVGAFPKFTDLASCDSHKLLVLDDMASGLGDKLLHWYCTAWQSIDQCDKILHGIRASDQVGRMTMLECRTVKTVGCVTKYCNMLKTV